MMSLIKRFALVGVPLLLAHGAAYAQVNVALVALPTQSLTDVLPALPASQTDVLVGSTFVLELWAQTTNSNGLAQVSADISYDPAVVSALSVTHTALFNLFLCGAAADACGGIDNVAGVIDNVSGSHLSTACVDQVGLAPNWARVAIIQMTAIGAGFTTTQSATTNDFIYVTSICGSLSTPAVTYDSAILSVSQCGNGIVEPLEQCDDGNTQGGDCCSATCQFEALSTSCEADGNLCTIDQCDGAGACVPFDNVICQPANPPCEAGQVCNPSSGTCDDLPDAPASTTCEADANPCTIDHCDGVGACATFDDVVCQAANPPCEAGQVCNPSSGACDNLPDAPVSTSCEADGNSCTIDHCDGAGVCATFDNVVCQTANPPCEAGQVCNPGTGTCDNLPDAIQNTPCEADGNFCTNDVCDGVGGCGFVSSVVCQSPNPPCEAGATCDPSTGACNALPDALSGTACNIDSNLCTLDACDGLGACVATGSNVACQLPVPPCESGEACNTNTGLCEALPDATLSTPCQADGNLCTIDHCDGAGVCVTFDNVVCQSPNPPCEAGQVCNAATGVCDDLPDAPLTTVCEADSDLCTIDRCDGAGACVTFGNVQCEPANLPCEGGEVCNAGTGLCEVQPDGTVGTVCEADGSLCTFDRCDGAGACATTTTVTCQPAQPPCEGGEVCNPATGFCDVLPDALSGTGCEADGDFCTIDRCNGMGACLFNSNVVCQSAAPPCEGGEICNSGTGLCDPLLDAPATTGCDLDGNLCSVDECDGLGACVSTGNSIACLRGDPPCEAGETCDPTTGACVAVSDAPGGTACDLDVNLCTIDECDGFGLCLSTNSSVICQSEDPPCESGEVCNTATGLCDALPDAPAGTPCQFDNNLCTDDECDGGGTCAAIVNVDPCDDGDACTTSDVCTSGTCAGVDTSAVDCDDNDPCTADSCDPAIGCGHLPLTGNACDDGDPCTQTDTCQTGVCTGTNPVACTASDQCHVAGTCDSATGVCSNPAAADGTLCDDGIACSGESVCITGVCEAGPPLCLDPCENCDPATDTCDWCQYDHNFSGTPDGFDFAFFSDCFGQVGVMPRDPCAATNYDRDDGADIGSADFALFSSCYAAPCGQCETCFGPFSRAAGQGESGEFRMIGASLALVPVWEPTSDGSANVLPVSAAEVTVGDPFYLEVWAARRNGARAGLASVYVDLIYDASLLTIEESFSDSTFGVFPSGILDEIGVVRRLGGCALLGDGLVGVTSPWVRVATLRVRAGHAGVARVWIGPPAAPYGVSLFGLGELKASDVEYAEIGLSIRRLTQWRPGSPNLRDGRK